MSVTTEGADEHEEVTRQRFLVQAEEWETIQDTARECGLPVDRAVVIASAVLRLLVMEARAGNRVLVERGDAVVEWPIARMAMLRQGPPRPSSQLEWAWMEKLAETTATRQYPC